MESTRELLQRRYTNRAISRRKAEAQARVATLAGRPADAAEAFARAAQELGACVEITGIARDLSIEFDNDALTRRIGKIESESEQAAQALGEEL